MRPSYGEQLIELDLLRRTTAYGRETKLFHLKLISVVTAALCAVCRLSVWLNPPAVSHAWIDDVLVEVVEDDRLAYLSVLLAYACGASLLLFALFAARGPAPHAKGAGRPLRPRGAPRRPVPAGSTIAVPARRHEVSPSVGPSVSSAVGPRFAALSGASGGAARPVRSDEDLRAFLSQHSAAEGPAPGPNAAFGSPLVAGAGAHAQADGIRVQYRCGAAGDGGSGSGGCSGGGSGSGAKPPSYLSDAEWADIGVTNAERSLAKTRKWVSDICQELADEIAAGDRWFAEHQISAFDTNHSLQESIPMPAQTGFAAATGSLRKLDALMGERQKLTGQVQNVQNFDTVLRLDQRLALEVKLDTAATFPPAAALPLAEQQARRQYILQRLRTFAAQKTFASYNHSRGDPDTWREGFPCDAHLLVHIVRVCVDGFANYVKFPHQAMNAPQDLALFVGDTGEPYFYVRHRSGSVDKTYGTHQGANSLFEALLIFAAVVRTYHNASYGGIWGVMDLSRAGLLNLF